MVLEADDQPPIIFDLGTGLRPYGDRAASGAFHGTALLSHLHWDHMQGLPFFAPLHVTGATLDVYGPRQDEGPLGDVFAQMMRPPFFPIRPTELDRRGALPRHRRRRLPGRAAPRCARAGCATSARRSASASSGTACRSRTSPTTARAAIPSDADDYIPPEVLELCDGVDLLIHDAQHTAEEYEPKRHWGHCTVEYAVHVAARGRRAQRSCCSTTTRRTATTTWTRIGRDAAELGARIGGPEVIASLATGSQLHLAAHPADDRGRGRGNEPVGDRVRSLPTPRPTGPCSATSRPAS